MATHHSSAFLALVDDAKTRIDEIDPATLRERLAANPGLHLVDVREESEYAAEHARGARHLGKGVLERDIEAALPDRDAEIVLYCGGGFRSALAADNLQKMGYTNVYSLAGGIRALRATGFEMKR